MLSRLPCSSAVVIERLRERRQFADSDATIVPAAYRAAPNRADRRCTAAGSRHPTARVRAGAPACRAARRAHSSGRGASPGSRCWRSLPPRTVAAHESSCVSWMRSLACGEVQAAVADVRHDQLTVGDQRADDRGPHPQIVVVIFGEPIDPPVRQAHGGLEPIGLVRQRGVDAVRPGKIGWFRAIGG